MRNYMPSDWLPQFHSRFFNALAAAESLLFLTSDTPEFG
jgi:hypothetical protein